jgi:hypothetical protein
MYRIRIGISSFNVLGIIQHGLDIKRNNVAALLVVNAVEGP